MYKYILSGILGFMAGAGIVGYLRPAIKEEQTKTSETQATKKDHEETTTVTVKEPNGTEKTTTKTVKDKDVTIDKTKAETKVVMADKLYHVSLMGGYDFGNNYKQVYGLSASKQFLGHLTVGAWGLTNGIGGLSLGVDF